ncbi:MAG: SpoIID/LytB domain-containing protein [bacterium]|nr:SpoIID/LytB domain-containing protein [bacterium]
MGTAKTSLFFLSILLFTFYFLHFASFAGAECPSTDYDCQIAELQREYDSRKDAHEKNKITLSEYEKQIISLSKKIISIEASLKKLEKDIFEREVDLGVQEEVLAARVRNYYINSSRFSPLLLLLSSGSAQELTRELAFRQQMTNQDRKVIIKTSTDLAKLKTDKETFKKSQISLAALKKKTNEQAIFMREEVAKTESFFAEISAKQQEILNAKNGSFIASVGDSDLADDINASIKGFRDSAPAGSFAVFSFGGYTHRKGMSQYGARGRAQNGQSTNQILKAYYGKEPVSKDTGGNISVAGVGSVNFEDYYLMGISEMPSSWHPEALKAQAIAARTYAYRYKIEGKQICTDEGCQVFRKSKADNPPAEWKQAVQQTRGQVLEDVVTYYSSTSGGFLTTMGWDTTDGSGGGNFLDKTYEKLGGSPWVYKAWYRKGYSGSGATCGQDNPWLNNEEFTDIVNAAVVLKSSSDDRVISTSTSCWGGNPYSYAEMRQKGGVNSVSSVSVLQGNGSTNEVVINGSIHLSGGEFKQAFNLRASGYLMIPQSGFSFFNIEKK